MVPSVADPTSAAACNDRGAALAARGEIAAARRAFEQALALAPGHAEAGYNLALLLVREGRVAEALAGLDRTLAMAPHHVASHRARGQLLSRLGREADALAAYDRALVLGAGDAPTYSNLAATLARLGRLDDACAACERALEIDPSFVDALLNHGAVLHRLRRHEEALSCYDRVIELQPDDAQTRAQTQTRRAQTLMALGRAREALQGYACALEIDPGDARALEGRCELYLRTSHWTQAAADCDALLEANPGDAVALARRAHSHAKLCRWDTLGADIARLEQAIAEGRPGALPFSLLAVSSSRAVQRAAAELVCATAAPAAPPPQARAKAHAARRDTRIRIGWLSADLRRHPLVQLMSGVLARLDRQRFESVALSITPPLDCPVQRQLRTLFDEWIELDGVGDEQAAAIIENRGIEILVDRGGHTEGNRLGIVARRPAPVQVSYLGYPGTTGNPAIDYMIADAVVVPPEHEDGYTERIVRLPDTYFATDSSLAIAAATPSRAELGLPEQGFVFCCFCASQKINAAVFDVWMRLLRDCPGSVLWLLSNVQETIVNLRREAHGRGIDPDRLRFAARADLPDHLARHRQADLFLDTWPYGAHTTGVDALWAGLPVVTWAGATFASRVAASQLQALGLPELVCSDAASYLALATALARSPTILADLRQRLAAKRLTAPLFDTDRFTRHFERALELMHERHLAGLQPVNLVVPRIARDLC